MAKKYRPLACGGYGWTGMHPELLVERMQNASGLFEKIRAKHNFQAIAFTGSSGSAIGFLLGVAHQIPLIYVRKDKEESHGWPVEYNGKVDVKRYLIVDDFVATGSTVRRIVNAITQRAKAAGAFPAKPCGVLCFDDNDCYGLSHIWLNSNERQTIPIFR